MAARHASGHTKSGAAFPYQYAFASDRAIVALKAEAARHSRGRPKDREEADTA